MKKYDAVTTGYICVDLIPDFKKTELISKISNIFRPGSLIEIDGLSFNLGGVIANTGMLVGIICISTTYLKNFRIGRK